MGIGGGWTFRDNLIKALHNKVEIVDSPKNADVSLVCGATMVSRDTFYNLKLAGSKVVLRVDGIPEDWRNRGTGWPRLKEFALQADKVVFQTKFSRDTVGKLIGVDGDVIYNGVDLSIFTTKGSKYPKFGGLSLLNINSRKDPNKRIEEVIQLFRELKTHDKGATLTFVGVYPTYLREWNFGLSMFEEGKDWQYLGVVKDRRELAKIMRSCDVFVFPSFADPCPNVVLEAMACGLRVVYDTHGGTAELVGEMKNGHVPMRYFIDFVNTVQCVVMKDKKPVDTSARAKQFSLEKMGSEYLKLFERVLNVKKS